MSIAVWTTLVPNTLEDSRDWLRAWARIMWRNEPPPKPRDADLVWLRLAVQWLPHLQRRVLEAQFIQSPHVKLPSKIAVCRELGVTVYERDRAELAGRSSLRVQWDVANPGRRISRDYQWSADENARRNEPLPQPFSVWGFAG